MESVDLVSRARDLCIRGHAGQKRDNGEEYFRHPERVAELLAEQIDGVDPILLATAYCHDLLEDTSITPEQIHEALGVDVLTNVKALTQWFPSSSKVNFYEKHYCMLQKAESYNDVCKAVKLADRYDNVTDALGLWKPRRVKRYAMAGLDLIDAMQPIPSQFRKLEAMAVRTFLSIV